MSTELTEALEELLSGSIYSTPLEVDIPPLAAAALRQEGVAEHLIEKIKKNALKVDLSYWFQRAGVQPDTGEYCGTVACLAGHLVLAAGAEILWRHPLQVASSGCYWRGCTWSVRRLATLIWRATYPKANIHMFYEGITNPEFIPLFYEGITGPTSAPALVLQEALIAFLRAASAESTAPGGPGNAA